MYCIWLPDITSPFRGWCGGIQYRRHSQRQRVNTSGKTEAWLGGPLYRYTRRKGEVSLLGTAGRGVKEAFRWRRAAAPNACDRQPVHNLPRIQVLVSCSKRSQSLEALPLVETLLFCVGGLNILEFYMVEQIRNLGCYNGDYWDSCISVYKTFI